MTETVRCFKCGLFCGESYGLGTYLLDSDYFCSIACYKEQRIKEETESIKPPKKRKKTNGRSKNL